MSSTGQAAASPRIRPIAAHEIGAGASYVILACFKRGADPGGDYRLFLHNRTPQVVEEYDEMMRMSQEIMTDGNRRKKTSVKRTRIEDEEQSSDSGAEPDEDSPSLFEHIPDAAGSPTEGGKTRRRRTEERTRTLPSEDMFVKIDQFNDLENKKRASANKLLDKTAPDYAEKLAQAERLANYHWYMALSVGPWPRGFQSDRFSKMLSRRSRSLIPRSTLADIMSLYQEDDDGNGVSIFIDPGVVLRRRVIDDYTDRALAAAAAAAGPLGAEHKS